jgi:hypothetical protein
MKFVIVFVTLVAATMAGRLPDPIFPEHLPRPEGPTIHPEVYSQVLDFPSKENPMVRFHINIKGSADHEVISRVARSIIGGNLLPGWIFNPQGAVPLPERLPESERLPEIRPSPELLPEIRPEPGFPMPIFPAPQPEVGFPMPEVRPSPEHLPEIRPEPGFPTPIFPAPQPEFPTPIFPAPQPEFPTPIFPAPLPEFPTPIFPAPLPEFPTPIFPAPLPEFPTPILPAPQPEFPTPIFPAPQPESGIQEHVFQWPNAKDPMVKLRIKMNVPPRQKLPLDLPRKIPLRLLLPNDDANPIYESELALPKPMPIPQAPVEPQMEVFIDIGEHNKYW